MEPLSASSSISSNHGSFKPALDMSGSTVNGEGEQSKKAIAHENSKLTYLSIWDGSNLTDADLSVLGKNCKMLRELEIYNLSRSSSAAGMRKLLEHCKLLRRLECWIKGISEEEKKLLQNDFPLVYIHIR